MATTVSSNTTNPKNIFTVRPDSTGINADVYYYNERGKAIPYKASRLDGNYNQLPAGQWRVIDFVGVDGNKTPIIIKLDNGTYNGRKTATFLNGSMLESVDNGQAAQVGGRLNGQRAPDGRAEIQRENDSNSYVYQNPAAAGSLNEAVQAPTVDNRPEFGPAERPEQPVQQQATEDTEQLERVSDNEANISNYEDTGETNKKEQPQDAAPQPKEPKPSNISWMGDLHNALSGWASAAAGNLINNKAIRNGYGTDPFRRDMHLNNQARMHAIQAGQEGGYADRDLQIGRQNNINVANAIAAGNDAVAYSNQAAKVGNRNAAALLNQETKSQANVEGQQQRSDQAWQRGVSGKRASWNSNQVAEQERAGADVYNGLARDMYTTNNFAGYVSMPSYDGGYGTFKSGGGNNPKQEAPSMAKAKPQNVINTLLGSMHAGSGKGMSPHDKELYSYVVKKFGVKPMKPTEHIEPYNISDSRTWEEEFASRGPNYRQAIDYLREMRQVKSPADNFRKGEDASTATRAADGSYTPDKNGNLQGGA